MIVILFWLHTNNISNFNQLYLYTYCLRRMHIISKLWPKIIFNNFLSYQIIGVYYNLALNFITFLKKRPLVWHSKELVEVQELNYGWMTLRKVITSLWACCFFLNVKRNFKEYDFWNHFQLGYFAIRMGTFNTIYVYILGFFSIYFLF